MDDFNIDELLGGITSDSMSVEEDVPKKNLKSESGSISKQIKEIKVKRRVSKKSTGSDIKNNLSKDHIVQNSIDANNVPSEITSNNRVSPGKVFVACVLGLLMSFIFFLIVGSLYTRYITYPDQEEVLYTSTGAYALDEYEKSVHSQEEVAGDNYLLEEITYCNSNASRLGFVKRVVGTVDYQPVIVYAKNVYGNVMIDRHTKETVEIPSYVLDVGEEVYFSYIDYETLDFPDEYVSEKLSEYNLSIDNVSYATILVDLFCDCVTETDDLPIKTELRTPNLVQLEEGFEVSEDEDIFLDNLLFSSQEFRDCTMRFAEKVGYLLTGDVLQPSDEWLIWEELPEISKYTEPEPYKYGKLSMLRDWCGVYYLQNNKYIVDDYGNRVQDYVKPQLGDGTFSSPASIGTSVVTYILDVDKDGNDVKYPIEVTLEEFGVSKKALDWFQSKHTQNRGYNLESEVQYYYGVFRVVNLSDTTITISDNSSLSDRNTNLSSKTGTIFGLIDEVKLKPDEVGYIETWGRSTELYKKYFIWGANFDKRIEPVWFRVLSGDLEDTSFDKGVHIINRSRLGSDINILED